MIIVAASAGPCGAPPISTRVAPGRSPKAEAATPPYPSLTLGACANGVMPNSG